MYKTKNITPQSLKKISVNNQKQIKELTGNSLDLVKAREIIRNHSSHFKKHDEKALEADNLLYEIYQKTTNTKTPKNENEKLRLQEQERARALELLELELQIAA